MMDKLDLYRDYFKVYIQLLPQCYEYGGMSFSVCQMPTFDYYLENRGIFDVPHFRDGNEGPRTFNYWIGSSRFVPPSMYEGPVKKQYEHLDWPNIRGESFETVWDKWALDNSFKIVSGHSYFSTMGTIVRVAKNDDGRGIFYGIQLQVPPCLIGAFDGDRHISYVSGVMSERDRADFGVSGQIERLFMALNGNDTTRCKHIEKQQQRT